MNTFRSIGREHLELFLHQAVFELLMAVIEEVGADKQARLDDKHFVANYYTYAISFEPILHEVGFKL